MKNHKSGRCHYLEPERSSRQPLMLGLNFNIISIFCLHRTLYKIHMWKLFVYGKIFARGKTKSGRKSLVKKDKNKNKQKQTKTKTGQKKKERVPFCQEKKKSFVKATGTGGALRWRPDFEQRSRLLTKICHT